MIFVDDRNGSGELLAPLQRTGLDVQIERLDSGDFLFTGRGVGDDVVSVGVERKRIDSTDLTSSIRSGRLSGSQLPKMLGPKGVFDYAWLIIEGQYRVSSDGTIRVLKTGRWRKGDWVEVPGLMNGSALQKHLLTLEVCGGLHVRFTNTPDDTVRFLYDLYRWFSDKPLDQHASHLDVPYNPAGFLPLSDMRRVLMGFPGVGRAVSKVAEKGFKSIYGAVTAKADQWAKLETTDRRGQTRRFGVAAAERLVQWLRQEQE